ncbi:acyl-CoA dehydrogenase family protein [Williamsia deligens]|uniref:Acyl-CoA dehydrogenase family protein n=1 Tax=Williamsia deligens TaxID=321325 RepID=A0ABW3G7L4_9NOCA|nr:acyl-CoA dehydrogenase family protein [Williamsia deligens]MCP2194369.1 Acyl-CoA dehydrogenase [Williamsia deligens]
MDFRPTDETTDVAGLARDIATKISTPEAIAAAEAAGDPIDARLWSALADAGLLALEADEADGGAGLGVVESAAVAQELGATLARVPFGPHAMVAVPVIATHAAATLRATWLPRITDGSSIISVGIDGELSEDPLAPTVTARPDGDGVVLDGTVLSVPFGRSAAAVIVTATAPDGVIAVLVETTADGLTIEDALTTGLVPAAHLDLAGVRVDATAVLGRSDVVAAVVARVTLAQCAEQVGVVTGALDRTADYAREREQFSRPIGSFQAVAQRLADGYIDVRAATLTTLQAAYLVGAGEPADTELATAKFWAADAGHRVAHTAVHVHGGVGIDTDHPLHRYFLRAKQNEFASGSATTALRRIGAALAAEPV